MENGDNPVYPILGDLLDRCGQVNFNPFGLTKREYFAGFALQGLLSNPALINLNLNPKDSMKDTVVVEYSIRVADELLKQLED